MKTLFRSSILKNKFYRNTFALLCFGFLAVVKPAIADDTGDLMVVIRGGNARNVSVDVSGGDLSTAYEKLTSSSGRAKFEGIPAGSYVVTPRKSATDFSPNSQTVTISSGKTTRIEIRSKISASKVGMNYCISCHQDVSGDLYADWLSGPHGNFDYLDASTIYSYGDFTEALNYPADYTKFTGLPNETTIATSLKEAEYSGKTKAYCLGCHGPSSLDNASVAQFPLVRSEGIIDTINKSAQVARPVIGCESCHGSGRTHISHPKKSVSIKEPSAVQCGKCHNKNFPEAHLTYHPAGAAGVKNPGIYEAYSASAHTKTIDDATLYTNAKKTEMKALCAKCHSDQGARIYRAKQGDVTTLPQKLAGEANHSEFSAVQCRTCHDPHNPTKFLENASAATTTATARSAQFNTCTNCHQLLNSSDAKITPYHNDHEKSITNSHFDDPATQALEGYNIHRTSDSACSMCHDPHVAGVKINQQWAESGHGDLTADPWTHYDWKTTARQACQRCHTPIGFANYVADQANYDATKNDFSHLTGLQNDNLTCNGCHTDNSFKRRKNGAYDGYVKFPSGALVTLDDDSNLCMMCHQGRASKVDVDTTISRGAGPYTSFTNIHYLAAAATFFGTETKGGYEYTGKTYVSRSTFSDHKGKLDTCVGCHLRKESADAPDHHFKPEVTDCAGSSCHVGLTSVENLRPKNTADFDGDGNTTEGLKGEVDTLRDALYTQIKLYASATVHFPIVYDTENNPYWFRDTNGNGIKDTGDTTGYNKFDAKLLKACYNYHVSVKEPHNYIHNHKYIVELLYDSLEDLGANISLYTRP